MKSFPHLMYRLYAITEATLSMLRGCGQAEKWKATNNIKVTDYQNQIKLSTYLIREPDTKVDISPILLIGK